MAITQKPKRPILLVVASILVLLQTLLWVAGSGVLLYAGFYVLSKGSEAISQFNSQYASVGTAAGANYANFVKDSVGVISAVLFFFGGVLLIISLLTLVASVRLFKLGQVSRWYLVLLELLGVVTSISATLHGQLLAVVWLVLCAFVFYVLAIHPPSWHAFSAASAARKGVLYAPPMPPQAYVPQVQGYAPQAQGYAPQQPGMPTQPMAPVPQAAYVDPSQVAQPAPMAPQQPVAAEAAVALQPVVAVAPVVPQAAVAPAVVVDPTQAPVMPTIQAVAPVILADPMPPQDPTAPTSQTV